MSRNSGSSQNTQILEFERLFIVFSLLPSQSEWWTISTKRRRWPSAVYQNRCLFIRSFKSNWIKKSMEWQNTQVDIYFNLYSLVLLQDPVVCLAIWETSLQLLKSNPDCWQHLNLQKAFMPQLNTALKNRCYGNASTIFPLLLPLYVRVPPNAGWVRTLYSTSASFILIQTQILLEKL